MKRRAAIAFGAVAVSILALGTGIAPATAAAAVTTEAVSVAPAQFGDLGANEPLRLFVTVDQSNAAGVAAGTAAVTVDRKPLTSSDALQDWFSGSAKSSLARTPVGSAPTEAVLGGATSTVAVSVPAARLKFGASGVYAIAVAVTSGSTTIGTARTAVVWKATGTDTVPVALAAPLTVPATAGTFLSSATLATDTAPTGVLTRELDELQDTQVAIGIDPRILASIRILGKSAPASAKAWLLQLEAVSNETFPLAWADADLTVALQAGAATVPAVKPLDYAINKNLFAPAPAASATPSPTATADPDNPPLPTSESLTAFDYTLPDLSWPSEDTVAAADTAKLTGSGIGAAILSSGNVTRPTTAIPPGASARVGDLSVEVSDETVSGYLRDAAQATSRAAWVSAMAKLTTSIAIIGSTSDGNANLILATFGRNWQNADTEFDPTLTALYTRSWIVSGRIKDAVTAEAQTVTIKSRPQSASRVATVKALLEAEYREVRFAVVTAPDEETLTSARRLSLLSLLSDEWLDDPVGWQTATTKFLKQSLDITTSVQVVKGSTIVLGGDQVSLPITVGNTLDQQVTVYMAVRPRTSQVTVDTDHKLEEVTINADSQRQVRIPIQSVSNGKVDLQVTLYTSNGHQLGAPKTIKIDVQAGWETLGTLIFAALVVGIFAFGVIRNIRKRRRSNAAEPVESAAGPAEGE